MAFRRASPWIFSLAKQCSIIARTPRLQGERQCRSAVLSISVKFGRFDVLHLFFRFVAACVRLVGAVRRVRMRIFTLFLRWCIVFVAHPFFRRLMGGLACLKMSRHSECRRVAGCAQLTRVSVCTPQSFGGHLRQRRRFVLHVIEYEEPARIAFAPRQHS